MSSFGTSVPQATPASTLTYKLSHMAHRSMYVCASLCSFGRAPAVVRIVGSGAAGILRLTTGCSTGCSYICFTCPAITVVTVILRALDRDRNSNNAYRLTHSVLPMKNRWQKYFVYTSNHPVNIFSRGSQITFNLGRRIRVITWPGDRGTWRTLPEAKIGHNMD